MTDETVAPGGDRAPRVPRLHVDAVSKRFGSVLANDAVSVEVGAGSIHGLVGENGAGKSTLAKILSGYQPADEGTIRLDGEPLVLRSPADALAAGIGLLHQDPLTLGAMTVLENFQLGTTAGAFLHPDDAAATLRETADHLGFRLEPGRLVRTLSVGERQQLELVRLLAMGVTTLMLDEPTTSISGPQRDLLFTALRRLVAEGLSVIYITHKLEEIDELCDRVTVLRAGAVVDDTTVPVDRDRLVRAMFGEIPELGSRASVDRGATVLRLRGVAGSDGGVAVAPVDLEVGAGEVVGLAGVDGSGQRTLLRMLAGTAPVGAGAVELHGDDLTNVSLADRRARRVEYLPADRLHDGLLPGLDLVEHALIAGRVPRRTGWRRFFLDRAAAADTAGAAIETFRIKATEASIPEELSGGNQQRVLLSLMPDEIDLLLLEHPTRGLDVSSGEWVWEQLSARRERGAVVIFASADLDELRRWSDRILVFFGGAVLAEVASADADADRLGRFIGGEVVDA